MCRVMAGVWRSEANLLESVLSFHQVGLGYWTRVLGLHGRQLDTLSYPASPISSFLLHFLKVILRFIVFMCMRVLSACMSVYHVPGALGGQKRESDPLTLESQMVVNRHVSAGNQTRVLLKCIQCSSPLSHHCVLAQSRLTACVTACKFIYLQAEEHLGCFWVLSFISKTAINICVQVFVQT